MISNELALRLIYNRVSTPPSLGQPWLHTNMSNVPSKNGNGESACIYEIPMKTSIYGGVPS